MGESSTRHPGLEPGSIDVFNPARKYIRLGGFVYIMASRKNGTLYVGVTSDLERRVWEHREKIFARSFTSKHNVIRLVWYLEFSDISEAIAHEKRLKRWRRRWKCELVESMNPDWDDLYPKLA